MDRSTTKGPSRQQLAERLKEFDQHHLLCFWEHLDDAGRRQLVEQISAIDFEQLDSLYRGEHEAPDWAALARRAAPPPAMRLSAREKGGGRYTAAEARARGEAALAAGEIGVLLVAGGQGSRLGFEHPKGLFPVGPVSGGSLLQIHLEKARAIARRYGAALPFYIMTSPVTHDEQVAFLAEHDRFGFDADDLVLFCQGTMPAVDAETGKLLLAEKDALFLSPNGHGGTVAALSDGGAIEHMQRRGIKHLFYFQVDNPLTPICDAEFIGYHLLAESDLTSMAVAKQSPQDKLGNFVDIDGSVQVIEYSDFPADVAEKRDVNGELVFWAGSIAVHMFAADFLERMLRHKDALPFHVARKKVPYLDESGRMVEPSKPNALKFERFIFDLLPHARNPLVVEYAEAEVFAPLKNAPGAERDTLEYVQRFMVDQHCRWLKAAGTKVAAGVAVEISPLWRSMRRASRHAAIGQRRSTNRRTYAMKLEVEQKHRIDDLAAFERQLAKRDVAVGEPIGQSDRYFAHPCRDFAKTDEALRIRTVGELSYLTYKGPKLDATTKTRRELELPLSETDPAGSDFAELLRALGFIPVATVRKMRRAFYVNRDGQEVHGAIDQVDGVGLFVELELSAEDAGLDVARQIIGGVAAELKLGPSERRSYLEMLLAK